MIDDGRATSRRGVRHPIFARVYAHLSGAAEEKGVAEHRKELLAGLEGRVVEVGAGNGLNFRHYPSAVTEVVAVEPEPHLRELAQKAAVAAEVDVTVVDGLADSLPLEAASCDAAVCSLVLCSVADQSSALAEVRRVLKPGGELRFYEHVLGDSLRFARFQRAVDLVHPYLAGGCHVSRATETAISNAGFEITAIRRFRFTLSPILTQAAPTILGIARRPDVPGPGV